MDKHSNFNPALKTNHEKANKNTVSQENPYSFQNNINSNNHLRENIKNVNHDMANLLNDGLPNLLEDDSIKIENVGAIKLKMHQAMQQCNTSDYENFQSLSSLFQEKQILDNILETQSKDLDDTYLTLLRKEFSRYFQVSEYYLDINLFGHKLRVELDNDGRVAKQYRFRYAEYLYSVGSQYVKMFRSLEENTGKIHSIKIATLLFSKPETYFSFLSCIKEAMLLNQLDKMGSHLLGLEGYFFRRKKSLKFWETEIQLVMILDDHDMTLLDLMRARRSLGNPWSQEQILQIVGNVQQMIDYVEEHAGVKIVGANPLNILYSKRKDS
jgi:hypothetical protein